MANLVIGVFTSQNSAETVIHKLETNGYKPADISIVMKDTSKEENKDRSSEVTSDVGKGAATGAIVGGIAALLGSLVIPGVGAFLIGGPIAAALGVSTVAGATISGIAIGAVAGGLIGALTDLGLSENEAKEYEKHVQSGGVLVAVPAVSGDENNVESLMKDYGGTNIKLIQQAPPKSGKKTSQSDQYSTAYMSDIKKKGGDKMSMKNNKSDTHYHQVGKSSGTTFVNPIQVEKFLKGVNYPASKQDLLNCAKQEGADANVLDTLAHIPDKTYDGPVGISEEIGKLE